MSLGHQEKPQSKEKAEVGAAINLATLTEAEFTIGALICMNPAGHFDAGPKFCEKFKAEIKTLVHKRVLKQSWPQLGQMRLEQGTMSRVLCDNGGSKTFLLRTAHGEEELRCGVVYTLTPSGPTRNPVVSDDKDDKNKDTSDNANNGQRPRLPEFILEGEGEKAQRAYVLSVIEVIALLRICQLTYPLAKGEYVHLNARAIARQHGYKASQFSAAVSELPKDVYFTRKPGQSRFVTKGKGTLFVCAYPVPWQDQVVPLPEFPNLIVTPGEVNDLNEIALDHFLDAIPL